MLRTVFVSYARKDSDRIQQAVALLEAGGAQVFRDIDGIEFGDDREEVITRKLQECERVMVFWSANAKASEWVGREYSIALAQYKRMVPVLLDNTPLPPELSRYHALSNFMPKRPFWKKYGGWFVGGVALIVLAGVVALPRLQGPEPASQVAPLVAESVDISPVTIVEKWRLEPDLRPALIQGSSLPEESSNTDSLAPGEIIAGEQVVIQPEYPTISGEQKPLPVFAWGAGLLSLLLLFLFWFRNRSDAPLKDEAVGKAFVDLVFDEE